MNDRIARLWALLKQAEFASYPGHPYGAWDHLQTVLRMLEKR